MEQNTAVHIYVTTAQIDSVHACNNMPCARVCLEWGGDSVRLFTTATVSRQAGDTLGSRGGAEPGSDSWKSLWVTRSLYITLSEQDTWSNLGMTPKLSCCNTIIVTLAVTCLPCPLVRLTPPPCHQSHTSSYPLAPFPSTPLLALPACRDRTAYNISLINYTTTCTTFMLQ